MFEPESVHQHRKLAKKAFPFAALLFIVFTFLWQAARIIRLRLPAGHDEAVYLLRSRDINELGWRSVSGHYWSDYRAPGLPLVYAISNRITFPSVSLARVITAAFGCLLLVGVWYIGKSLVSHRVGLIACGLIIMTPSFLNSSTNILADVPGASLALCSIVLFLRGVKNNRFGIGWLGVPLFAGLATLTRFGSPITLGAGFLSIMIATFKFWRPYELNRWFLKLSALAFLVVAVCSSIIFTELFTIAGETPTQSNHRLVSSKNLTPRTGLRDLVEVSNPWSEAPFHLWSGPIACLFCLGLLLTIWNFVRNSTSRSFALGMASGVLLTALGLAFSVGLIVSNYLVIVLPFLSLLVAPALDTLLSPLAGRDRNKSLREGFIFVVAFVFAMFVSQATVLAQNDEIRSKSGFEIIRASATELGMREDHKCVILTSYAPQVGYYSKCRVNTWSGSELLRNFDGLSEQELDDLIRERLLTFSEEIDSGFSIFAFLLNNGKRQPEPHLFEVRAIFSEPEFVSSRGAGSRQTAWAQKIKT